MKTVLHKGVQHLLKTDILIIAASDGDKLARHRIGNRPIHKHSRHLFQIHANFCGIIEAAKAGSIERVFELTALIQRIIRHKLIANNQRAV